MQHHYASLSNANWLGVNFDTFYETNFILTSCFFSGLCLISSFVARGVERRRDLPDIKNIFRWQPTEIDFRFARFTLFLGYPAKSIGLRYIAVTLVSNDETSELSYLT